VFKKASWLFIPLIVLLVLGGLNVYRKIAWKEPTDGVVWEKKAVGLTAVRVDPNGPASRYTLIKKGDILYSINDNPVTNEIDLVKNLWRSATAGQKVTYQIYRQGEVTPFTTSLMLGRKGVNLVYLYLSLIGLMTLAIALIVFFNSPKPWAPPHIYFYLLCFLLYSFYIFSPTGELDILDTVFFWLDKFAFLAFPPLLLHFFLIYPQRKRFLRKNKSLTYVLYLPAVLLLLCSVLFHLPYFNNLGNNLILRVYGTLEKTNLAHFALYTFLTLAAISASYLRQSNLIVRKQLKWIVSGLGFGVIPFNVFYVVPFLSGYAPTQVAELTILLQALVPLAFSYSISRFKLMDLEVIIKKAATLVFSYFVLAVVYLLVSAQTKIFAEYRFNALILGILAIVLGATLFSPIKRLFQALFDKVFYRRSYQYRKTLLSISKELSRERNLENLSRSLLELIANALSLRNIALLLPVELEPRTFSVFSSQGQTATLPGRLILASELYQDLRENQSLLLYSEAEKKDLQDQVEALRSSGLEHLLALKVEDNLIGCLAMGRKTDATYLTSEDWELLTTISSPVALALENAYLYNQASLRTQELERLKDYSENIIESLTVGVAVLDQSGRIIGWNRVLEDVFAKKKGEVIGGSLRSILGPKNFASLFPTETHPDYHLLSEIPIDVPSGERKIFDIAKTPLLDNRLNPYGTIIVFEDITEKTRLQQQLLTSEKLASIGLLSAGVAHEINTPLTGISSYVQMLQKKISDTHFAQILEKIETQTDRVTRIIKNLLNFARNPADFSFHRVDLKENLEEIVSLIDYKLKTMKIRLEMSLAALKPLWAQGERLQQVFINIILNAMDAMPHGGTLKIDLAENGTEAVIRISDTGTGIKEDHLPRIFDPFFTTKGLGKGTGLGLSISYEIIKEHEGRIDVTSEVGKGTSFTISIPKDLDRKKIAAPGGSTPNPGEK
jgi:two-component system NtrC family sensor kinase